MQNLTAQELGLKSVGTVHHNLSYDELFTGRSPKDKYFVQQGPSADNIAWGNINKPVSQEIFDELYAEVIDYLSGKDLFVLDGYCGANL